MSVFLYEGWDMHQERAGNGIHALGILDWDGIPEWDHGGGGSSGRGYDYGAGYAGGQAMTWYRASVRGALYTTFSAKTELRASWFSKPRNKGTATHAMCSFQHSGTNQSVALRHTGLTGLDVGTLASASDFTGTARSVDTLEQADDWAHYEMYLNSTTGQVIVRKNGEIFIDEVITMLSSAGFVNFRIHANGSGQSTWWDHIILTTGESLRDTAGYSGVGVTWSGFGKATGTSTGIRARINVGGNTYFGTTYTMATASVTNYSPEATNVYTQFWMNNPATSAAWGTELNVIESWGLCRTDDTGGWLITPSMFLSYIVNDAEGAPVVQYIAPTTALMTDPPWVRTHAERPWHEHVDNYPRLSPSWNQSLISNDISAGGANPNPFDSTASGDSDSVVWTSYAYDDLWYEDYLGCTGPGCLTFSLPIEEDIETPTPYGGTGLAFAEEFRSTYKDWESIVDGGQDFCSYFITGYKLHGDASKKFQSNYLTVNYETDVLGSAYIQGVWDYALANTPGDAHSRSDTGRWGSTQQIYGVRNDEDYKHAFAKLKIRGHGRAMQMKVKCAPGKPFWINGWSMFVTGNSTQ